ncbi:hypothetical protein AS29_008510 [Bacillus sp. SJS]|nr:hypothetical protein AS29_008510 [Bacillus sp. SJS]
MCVRCTDPRRFTGSGDRAQTAEPHAAQRKKREGDGGLVLYQNGGQCVALTPIPSPHQGTEYKPPNLMRHNGKNERGTEF